MHHGQHREIGYNLSVIKTFRASEPLINRGSGSSDLNVMPLVVDGSSGGSG